MAFRWEALTLRGAGGRAELRFVRTDGVAVTMTPYDGPGGPRYVVEVRDGDGSGRTERTVGTTDDYSTALAMVIEAVLDVEGVRAVGR